ncbi:MAG: hypothetical protein JSW05_07010 [Candidatus Thorarchaeota archaeon]|nr:MAG: hypothetical protein JSW05_07010 [Candidatus Thorarchaeota archaeon]
MNHGIRGARIALIVSSVCLLVTTLGQLYLSLTGGYGNEVFATLDSISTAFFIIWLITLLRFVVRRT